VAMPNNEKMRRLHRRQTAQPPNDNKSQIAVLDAFGQSSKGSRERSKAKGEGCAKIGDFLSSIIISPAKPSDLQSARGLYANKKSVRRRCWK
jgi:hypothetical protein